MPTCCDAHATLATRYSLLATRYPLPATHYAPLCKQETTNAVMAAMLMHDLLNAASPKNPANRAKFQVDNSLELFRTQAVHGGLWRSPYKLGTIGIPCALIYFGGLLRPYLAALSAITGASYLYLTLA